MEKFNFLVKKWETEKEYLAVKDIFETMLLSSTYDQFGQSVSTYDAGDSFEIKTQEAADFINKKAAENEENINVNIGDVVNAYNEQSAFNFIEDLNIKEKIEGIESLGEVVESYNYWDGHNWKSIIISADSFEPDWKLITKGELWEDLNNAIEKMEYVKELFGKKLYETEEYEIEENYCQGHFESYRLIQK